MFSVIVVTFNRAEYLFRCLNSILKQTYNGIEVIVVDDGSTDNSKDIVHSFNDNRIIYINEGKKGNVSLLRNIGIKRASYEYIAFCDDDDMWSKDKLEILIEYMATEKIVCTNAFVVDDKDKVIYEQITPFSSDRYVDIYQLLVDNRIQTSCVAVRRDVLEEVGLFDEHEGNRSEDWCVWIKIALKYKIKYVNRSLVSYRVHESNLSRKSYIDKIELAMRNIEILRPFLKNSDKKVIESARKGLSLVYKKLTNLNYRNGFYNRSLGYCREYLRFSDRKFTFVHFKYLVLFLLLFILKCFEKKRK